MSKWSTFRMWESWNATACQGLSSPSSKHTKATLVAGQAEPQGTLGPRSTESPLLSAGTEASAGSADAVPPLATFSGEDRDGVTFVEWYEQLELGARLCGWLDQVNLVNLATRLKGVAYAFYCSCTAAQITHPGYVPYQCQKRWH